MVDRNNFGKLKEVIQPPNLIEIQINSYLEYLQKEVAPTQRKPVGLEAVFREVFPIQSYDERLTLEYVSYTIGEPKNTELECYREGITYSVPLYVKLRLREEAFIKDEEIYMGEIPMVTDRGSFIINGADRVVVSQLHRSPGICFEVATHPNGKLLHSFRIIPDRGTWLEVQFDNNDLLYVYLDRRRRRRKFLITTLLRALGYSTDVDILGLFYEIQDLETTRALELENVSNLVLVEDAIDAQKGVVLARAFEPLTKAIVRQFEQHGIHSLRVIDTTVDEGAIIRALKKDPTRNEEEALKEIYKRLRPGEPPTVANSKALLKRLFFDAKRYDLGRVGRYKINQKLNLKTDLEAGRILNSEDIVEASKYLIRLKKGEGVVDDIDHLGSRRVRTVGELLANQCRVGLARTERLVRERMTLFDQSVDSITPQKLINPKALTTVIRDFFARSQLSQFMDQINPLAELTHKRRLSALGPGGLNRDRAGFEVRDVHPSHYGRICPIETPEGPNIGLINSLSIYSRVNEFGFIETPYRICKGGRASDKIDYLTADQEEGKVIAQANSEVDDKGHFIGSVVVRKSGNFLEVDPQEVDYMDVSPKQLVSVAAGLVPFLEHDDANRALMGSNMQRQGVPLLQTQAPYVGTGIEERVARDSKTVVVTDHDGIVASVDARRIVISKDGELPARFDRHPKSDPKAGIWVYELRKFMRSNAGTCFNQKPIVRKGAKVKAGDIIADGPSTDRGELALGRNVLVAFMPWNGYNFEDAILISEKVLKEDIFTSIHIQEFEVTARDTKLGPEEITRDIPNVGEDALKNLDHNGVIRIGAEVNPGDILVGKITPKGESPMTPEEKLLRAIFGEKASDVRDTSLRLPPGVNGTVVEVRVFNRHGVEKDERAMAIEREEIERLAKDRDDELAILDRNVYGRLKDVLMHKVVAKGPKGIKM
ncbi:MAG: DNA-directed RNA polymerase subunit beta, partial [Opitutaceae bacterium]